MPSGEWKSTGIRSDTYARVEDHVGEYGSVQAFVNDAVEEKLNEVDA